MIKFMKSCLLAVAFSAIASPALSNDWQLGIDNQDIDGNRLWDYVEKTKQPMMRELGVQDVYSNAMSDRLQFLMQEGILNVKKPEVFERIVKAQVREMACLVTLADTDRLVMIVSALEVAFAKHQYKSDGFKMVTDEMVRAAYNRPDVTAATCSWQQWPRNDHSRGPVKKPVYTARIVHGAGITP